MVLSLALVLLAVLVYRPISRNSFINFDDNHYITQNTHITSALSWETVKWAFTTFDAANWHPLTWLSHSIDYQLFGLSPAGHHFMSVLFHAANAVLLFLLFEGLTGLVWQSWLLSALFAIHPLNVESVVWAAERKTVLSMCFFLLALLAYSWYTRNRSAGRYLVVTSLFACALMSKPQVITFPFVLLLLDYWPLNRMHSLSKMPSSVGALNPSPGASFSWLLAEKLPWLVLSTLSAFVTLRAQRAGNAVRSSVEYSFGSRIETALTSYMWYLRDIFFPRHLAPIYPHPSNLIASWKVLLALSALVSITVLAIVVRKRSPYVLFGWLWFLGTLVPMIGLVQVGEQARADRYMYIPEIGIFVLVVWGATELLDHFHVSLAWRASLSATVIAVLSFATYRQIGLWKNSETLWNYTISVTHDNFMAEDNLAQELATQGRTEEALVHFHRILNLHKWSPSDLITFGVYEQRHGYAEDALKQYRRALQDAADVNTRATAFSNIGSAYIDLKDENKAEQSFESALQLQPNNLQALVGSGLIAQKRGDLEFAVQHYKNAVALTPNDLGYELLGRALDQLGRKSEAADAYRRARMFSHDYDGTRSTAESLLAK